MTIINPNELIKCPRCQTLDAMTFKEWPGPCKTCKESKEYKDEQIKKEKEQEKLDEHRTANTSFKTFPDIKAVVKDKAGKEFGLDVHNKLHSMSDTHYDLKNDPNGWKSSGIKTKK